MVNQRNVEALTALIEDFHSCVARGYVVGSYVGQSEAAALAEALSASGVLVPSALTDKQLHELVWNWVSMDQHSSVNIDGDRIPGDLESIAKGEA